jgi:hypothetical protein
MTTFRGTFFIILIVFASFFGCNSPDTETKQKFDTIDYNNWKELPEVDEFGDTTDKTKFVAYYKGGIYKNSTSKNKKDVTVKVTYDVKKAQGKSADVLFFYVMPKEDSVAYLAGDQTIKRNVLFKIGNETVSENLYFPSQKDDIERDFMRTVPTFAIQLYDGSKSWNFIKDHLGEKVKVRFNKGSVVYMFSFEVPNSDWAKRIN